jgi:hypothetical protein
MAKACGQRYLPCWWRFFLPSSPVSVFLLLDDLRRGVQWVAAKMFFSGTEGESIQDDNRISRSLFLTWFGLAAGGAIFGSLIRGFWNKYNYQVQTVPVQFANLPAAFKGLKIVQLSDVHSGSFTNKAAVERGIQKIMALQPILFFLPATW